MITNVRPSVHKPARAWLSASAGEKERECGQGRRGRGQRKRLTSREGEHVKCRWTSGVREVGLGITATCAPRHEALGCSGRPVCAAKGSDDGKEIGEAGRFTDRQAFEG